MNGYSRIAHRAGTLVLALVLLLHGAAARAEVGIVVDDDMCTVASGPYIATIIDDTDPVTNEWFSMSMAGSTRIALNPDGAFNGDGPPSMLRNYVSGIPIVAWAWKAPTGYDVVISRFENCVWTDPEIIAGSDADELDPYLFPGPQGEVHMVYWVEDGNSQVVYHRQAPADLSSWSDATRVSSTDEQASRPAGVFHDGVLLVSYEIEFGEDIPKDVVLARREGDGFVFEVLARSYNSGLLRSQPHGSGERFWVDWIDITTVDEFNGEMAWLRQDLQGVWEASRYVSFGSEEERDYQVRGDIRHQATTLP